MQNLNLPSFEFKIKQLDGGRQIFDDFRKKFVSLTPEEWVRQRFLRYLVNFKNYPLGLISVEKELKIGSLKRRPDAVVYNRNGEPRLVIEFKSPDVDISEETFFQIAQYNKKLKVPFVILSNGIEHFMARIDLVSGSIRWLDDFPEYNDL